MRVWNHGRHWLTFGVLALWGLPVAVAVGQESTDELIARAEAARDDFRPMPADAVAEKRAAATRALDRLEAFLLQGGSEANAQRWKDFLLWGPLQDALATQPIDLAPVGASAVQFFEDVPGLEMAPFTRARDALVDLLNTSVLAANPDLEAAYREQLDQLVEQLRAHEADPTDAATLQGLGRSVDWLERAGQADALVTAIRDRFWMPNFYARVSSRLLTTGFVEPVDDVTTIRDNILGTAIRGTVQTEGTIGMELIPDPDRIAVDIVFQGTAYSNNIGLNRGVTLYTTGRTDLLATKRVYVTDEGIWTLPAEACASTQTQINSICARGPFVERLAWRQASRKQGQAEAIASRHAEARVEERVDSQAVPQLDDLQETIETRFRHRLLRRNEYPVAIELETTADAVMLAWTQANASQLAAPNRPPAPVSNHDVSLRLHESMVANFSRAMLGGVTLTDERLAEILEELTGEVPEELQITQEEPPWSITFAPNEPVSADFRDGELTFAIRGLRFTQGNRVVSNVRLSSAYRLERTELGARLTRIGDVQVEYLDGAGQPVSELSSEQIAVRAVMRRKFEALFELEFETDGLTLPGRWEQIGDLRLREMISRDGWIALDWDMPSAIEPVAGEQPATVEPAAVVASGR